ncbi:creatininase family protein [Lederbergia wuyishanensis]|uniref:Creatinine amidohydrolase n=1 Tax=Lederbergia wuyishanensis TaxID=1347903 RepID=A0ABU0D8U8_9BACI|nr:creatininase family protein [Lederbergia wuyishanensis]MCJ8007565.1 creatininase family protein [Lederbergia wuyishanensis]MDQ0344852.1 creatinine amidohydrolase [Lederbergia wuyishanensis]
MKKVFLNEFTAKEIKEKLQNNEIDSAITMFGACESHGWHLPLGPDIFVPTEIAKRTAERLDKTVVVPGIPYGTSIHYNKFPITVSIRYETTIAIAEDIFTSLIEHGIKHIIILNGHDGNIPALEVAARNVKARYKEAVLVYIPAWWEITGEQMKEDFEVWDGLGHGGEGETSITMAVRPELVNLDDAICQMPHDMIAISEHASVIFDIEEITETGAIGDPTKATMEKGEKMLNIVVDYLVNLIKNLENRNWKYDLKK